MSTDRPWSERWAGIEPLGGGGQGDTLLVNPISNGAKRAVLKLLKPQKARRRMYQEVANLKILRSAGGKVPEVLDGNTESFDDTNVPLYFVMEHIVGDTLANLIQKSSLFSVQDSVGIALDLCSTLRIAVSRNQHGQ